ncbi:MAG TPA: hypothetical protein VHA78_05510 [Candidatus Peribacteraceae bacterium]|nr:hypothetical protein [Candidatus Peribacteraceae bacterium]
MQPIINQLEQDTPLTEEKKREFQNTIAHVLAENPASEMAKTIRQRIAPVLEKVDSMANVFGQDQAMTMIERMRTLLRNLGQLGMQLPTMQEKYKQECQAIFGHTADGRSAAILGEYHGNMESFDELSKIVLALSDVDRNEILMVLEEGLASSMPLETMERNAEKSIVPNVAPGAMYCAHEIAKIGNIPVEESIVTYKNRLAIDRAVFLIQKQYPGILREEVIACYINEGARSYMSTTPPDIWLRLQDQVVQYIAENFASICNANIDSIRFAMNKHEMLHFLLKPIPEHAAKNEIHFNETIAGHALHQAIDEITIENIRKALERHPSAKWIVCFAGASHVKSIKQGLGFTEEE